MKKYILLLIFISYSLHIFSQPTAVLKDSTKLKIDHFVGIDSFGAIYAIKENIFQKKWNNRSWQYGDFSLGALTYASILNPLKIMLFYESSNTVVLIDKYLNEINRTNFNTISEFKALSTASAANDNTIWVFDMNTQQLDLFNTNTTKTILKTQPINEIPTIQRSNFNYCWILTSQSLTQFNIYGSLLNQYENTGFINFIPLNKNLIVQKEDGLYYLSISTKEFQKINLPEIQVKQFYVTQEILYIYDQTTIYSFDLTPQKK